MRLPAALFHWPSRHEIHVALPLFIGFAFIVHAMSLLVFQVTYPKTEVAQPSLRSPQVYFLREGSPEALALEPRLQAEDPALFSPTQVFGREVMELPQTEYVASFDSRTPTLEALPVAGPGSLAGDSSVSVLTDIAGSPRSPVAGVAGRPTILRLGGDLKGRGMMLPPANFQAVSAKNLANATFLIAVSPEGNPLHVIPQSPAGDEKLDQLALAYLTRTRFSPADKNEGTLWGTATFQWGADVKIQNEP